MVLDPIDLADLNALLPMIEPALEGWSLKSRIVQRIGAVSGGDWFGAPEAARLVGRSPGRCQTVLKELDEARVILRDDGGGGRKFWCEVNPDWRRWDVPWLWPSTDSPHADQVREIGERLAYVRERRLLSAHFRLIDTPGYSRYTRIIATQSSRDAADENARSAPADADIATNRGRDDSGITNMDRGSKRSRSVSQDREHIQSAIVDGFDRLHTYISGVLTNSLPREEGSSEHQPTPEPHETPEVRKVIEAIEAVTTRVYAGLETKRVPELVATWGADRVLAEIPLINTQGMKSPALVKELEHRLEAAARDKRREEFRELKRNLAALQAAGGGAPAAELARFAQMAIELDEPSTLPMPIVVEPPRWSTEPPSEHPWAKRAAAKAAEPPPLR